MGTVLLGAWWGCYRLALRSERSFGYNRAFLVAGPLLAVALPLLPLVWPAAWGWGLNWGWVEGWLWGWQAAAPALPPVRLAIVDDHILFRKGLRALLSSYPGIEIVGEAGNGQELLELLDAGMATDVILMDMQMPVLDGLQTTRLLRGQYPAVRVVIISMHDDPSLVQTVLADGASAYLIKNTSPDEVRDAVLAAAGR